MIFRLSTITAWRQYSYGSFWIPGSCPCEDTSLVFTIDRCPFNFIRNDFGFMLPGPQRKFYGRHDHFCVAIRSTKHSGSARGHHIMITASSVCPLDCYPFILAAHSESHDPAACTEESSQYTQNNLFVESLFLHCVGSFMGALHSFACWEFVLGWWGQGFSISCALRAYIQLRNDHIMTKPIRIVVGL